MSPLLSRCQWEVGSLRGTSDIWDLLLGKEGGPPLFIENESIAISVFLQEPVHCGEQACSVEVVQAVKISDLFNLESIS